MWKKSAFRIPLAIFLVLAIGGGALEIFARVGLGLGTPPLYVADPEMEYRLAPNQDRMRFGNRQLVNAYGMRSPAMASVTAPRRIMVFGDSVLNGGNLTDHDALATTILSDEDIFYGNVSAGSWGPANIAGWIDTFGLLGAERVVFVMSTHDLHDAPTFLPLDPRSHPTRTPPLAIVEGAVRYLPRYLPKWMTGRGARAPAREAGGADQSPVITALLSRIAKAGLPACLVHHRARDEVDKTADAAALDHLFAARGVPVVDLGPYLQAEHDQVYLDDIHINARGQRLLAEAIRDCAMAAQVPDRP